MYLSEKLSCKNLKKDANLGQSNLKKTLRIKQKIKFSKELRNQEL